MYYTSFIIENMIFRPRWLEPFSNWSKYNASTRKYQRYLVILWSNWTRSHGQFDWLHSKTLSKKNRYWKVRESLEIDVAVLRYRQDKVLNRGNGNFRKTNAWKLVFKKMKTLHWNLTSFCIWWRVFMACLEISSPISSYLYAASYMLLQSSAYNTWQYTKYFGIINKK